MKRELAFALEVQSQCGLIGRTRSTKTQTSTPSETTDCSGQLKIVNDESEGNDSCDQIRETKNRWDGVIPYSRNKRQRRLEEPKNNERREGQKTGGNDSVVVEEEKSTCGGDLVGAVCEEETKSPYQEVSIKEEELIDEREEAIKNTIPRRFTRSALKMKVYTGKSSESDSEFNNSVAIGLNEKTNTGMRSLTSPKKLELKMSKKIALSRVPLTIRDLLETGMLEGRAVTYDGRKKVDRLILNDVYLTKLIFINWCT